MTEQTYVFGAAQDDAELVRLRVLEEVFDPSSRKQLLATGLGLDWRCLEIGAGAGSIARWMSKTVGDAGHVLAVDLNTRFLPKEKIANLEVRETDIRTATIEPASFDLAHARFVLIHIAQWRDVLDAVISYLKPGAWLVLEEPDHSSARALAGPEPLRRAFDNVQQAICAMYRRRGMDPHFGARLPTLLQERGFEALAFENDAAIVRGGSAHATMMAMSVHHLSEPCVATNLATEEDIRLYGAFAADPTCWATHHATIRAIGRKPSKA